MNSKKYYEIKFVLYIEFSNDIKNNKKLLDKYNERILEHNKNMFFNSYYDSGFDLLMKNQDLKIPKNEVKLVSLDIKCACYNFDNTIKPKKIPVYKFIENSFKRGILKCVKPYPFKIFPRSSMWKKGVLLANSTGIIDSGYRGFLFAPLFSFKDDNIIEYNDTSEELRLLRLSFRGLKKNIHTEKTARMNNRYVQICMPGLERFLIKVVDKLNTNTSRCEGGCGSTGN